MSPIRFIGLPQPLALSTSAFTLTSRSGIRTSTSRDVMIICRRSSVDPSLPACPDERLDVDPSLPPFPTTGKEARMIAFFDAAHGNDLRNGRSTAGHAFVLSGGIISYRCKTQSITATSSTEAEFLAAVLTAKQAKYLRSTLKELGFEQPGPTTLYCDNQSAINMANARVPAERSSHIDIQHFAIQD